MVPAPTKLVAFMAGGDLDSSAPKSFTPGQEVRISLALD